MAKQVRPALSSLNQTLAIKGHISDKEKAREFH
jgi:hypothetical protein